MYKESIPSVNDNGDKTRKNKIIVALFALLPILFVVLFFYAYQKLVIFEGHEIQPKDEVSSLEGEIYLTLSPLETNKPNIYKLDLETMELEEYFKDSPYRNYVGKFTSDFQKMMFVRLYADDMSQVLLLDESTQKISEITSKSEFFPRDPVFSPDNAHIAYWVYEGEENELPFGFGKKPENHKIYISDLEGNEQYVADGVFPLFGTNKEEIYFFKKEGIYKKNLENNEESLWFDFVMDRFNPFEEMIQAGEIRADVEIWMTMRFNFSKDRELFIISDTFDSIVYVCELNLSSAVACEEGPLVPPFGPSSPNWPVFSPIGNYVVMQTVKYLEGAHQNQISIFSLLGEIENLKDFDLSKYEQQNIWVSDWILR